MADKLNLTIESNDYRFDDDSSCCVLFKDAYIEAYVNIPSNCVGLSKKFHKWNDKCVEFDDGSGLYIETAYIEVYIERIVNESNEPVELELTENDKKEIINFIKDDAEDWAYKNWLDADRD